MRERRDGHARWVGRALCPDLIRALPGVLLAALLTGCGQRAGSPRAAAPPAPVVSVAEVVVKEVTQWDEFTGHIEAVDTVEIRPRVAGYIERLVFKEGEEVKKGEVLFVIDQRSFQAELLRAEADLARAHARSQLARAQVARARKLVEKRVISADQFDERLAADAQATADIRGAEAAAVIARLNLEYTEVRSPIDGRAGRALVRPGNLVSGGEMIPEATLLTTVVSLDPVYVSFECDEPTYLRYGAMAHRGERQSSREVENPVLVGLADERGFPHEGRMDFVDNQLDPATGTIRARAVLDNPSDSRGGRPFTPGLFARIKLLGSGTFSAVLVDDKAILTDQDRRYAFVLGADNTAERRDVRLGRIIDGLRVVTEGINAGERIIVHGVQKVFSTGMPVTPKTVGMGDPPPPPAPAPASGGGEPAAPTEEPNA
ncbi:MAG: efflux RND transporter periplasmic adaptor subunit [Gammaproteobacteria bacterium]